MIKLLKMLLHPVLIYLFATIKPSFANQNSTISFINNFVDKLGHHSQINVYACWDKGNLRTLFESLSRKYAVNVFKSYHDIHPVHYPENQIFVMDIGCDTSIELLKKANILNMFRNPFKWILYGNASLDEFYFGLDSQVFVIGEDLLSISTIYKHSPSSALNTVQISSLPLDNSIRNRTNLMGLKINVTYVVTNPDTMNHLWDYRDKHVDSITKMNFFLLHHLFDFLNASENFIMQTTWGYKNRTTGIYSGMAGDLQQGFSELGGSPLFFTPDRIDIIDYVASTTRTYMRFIFRAPPLTYVTNVFTLPFDTRVWHYCFVLVPIIAICIYIIVLWEWKDTLFRQKIEDKYTSLRPNIFDVIMLEIGAISQQGTDVEPKSVAGRIATIFTFITLMFLYTSYSANIVALLQSTTDSIRTLEDLLNSRISLGVEDIVYAHHYFETATEPVRKAIFEQKIAPKGQKPNFLGAEEGIKKMQQGSYAFHIELSSGYKIVGELFQEGEKCGLKEIDYIQMIEPWISTKKNSAYKEVIKVGMKRLHECGIQNREFKKIYTSKPVCHSKGNHFASVGLIDCYSAFLFYAVGLVIAIILFLFEVIVMRASI